MSIRRRGKTWQVDYTDITGKRVRQSGFKKKEDAEIFYAQARVNKSQGISNILDKELTLKDACDYFLNKYMQIRNLKQKVKEEYTRVITKIILPFFGNAKLYLISKKDVEDFILYLKNDRHLSSASVVKYKILLGSIIERQVENEAIFKNVVKQVHCESVVSREARALTPQEVVKLFETCKKVKPNFYPMLATAVYTGMRRGELVALMWENVDFANNCINVKYSAYKENLCSPKTKSSNRKFIIPSRLKKILNEQRIKTGSSKYVFPNSKGEMYLGDNVFNRLFLPVRNACGIGHFTFKDLRHTFSTSLVTNGVDPKTVQKLMGHSSSVITLDVYTHSLQTSYKKVGEVLNNLYQL